MCFRSAVLSLARCKGRASKLEPEEMETPGVKKAFLLTFSGVSSSYLFVRWVPDASNCQYKLLPIQSD